MPAVKAISTKRVAAAIERSERRGEMEVSDPPRHGPFYRHLLRLAALAVLLTLVAAPSLLPRFVQLLLTGFAFFSLGRRKTLDPFLLTLLCVGSAVGFRTARDSWFICIPAAACIAESFASSKRDRSDTVAETAGLGVAVALLILLYARTMGFKTPNLRLAINSLYPVQAINFLHDHPQRGPVYNTFGWGGFISWYLPEYPLAIDGRTDLYGDQIDTRFYLTENGDASYGEAPYLAQSNLILLPRQTPLTRLPESDAEFSLIYQDSLAAVFVRR